MRLMPRDSLPTGDGHAVVIFPGLAAEHRSVGPMKRFCEELGYAAYDWGRGFNIGPEGDLDRWLNGLAQHVYDVTSTHRQRISLIGWSLGGIYAREVAKKLSRRVRQVITLGTPIGEALEHNHANWLYRVLNRQRPVLDDALLLRMRTAPPVPTTSIFSRADGIVAWQACLQEGTRNDIENIEVHGSHCGLGWNAAVFEVIADRLSQPENRWQRHPRGLTALEALKSPDAAQHGARHWQTLG
jgi:pimeloyl-ACP methyl ester carboxylesterase